MHAAFMRERRIPHIGLMLIRHQVGNLGDECRRRLSGASVVRQGPAASSSAARLGIIEQRFALPQRSPIPLIVPCTCRIPDSTATSELATAISQSLCAWMPSGTGHSCLHHPANLADFPRHRPAVRIAENHAFGARASIARLIVCKRILGIRLIPIEEMLGIVEHPTIFDRRYAWNLR